MKQFTKMHGLGNDFIVFEGPFEVNAEQVAKWCDRHLGIGADGLLVVTPIDEKNVKMQYWNADGSVAEMCGNGLRCVTRFAVEHEMVAPGSFVVETGAGRLSVNWDGQNPDEIEVQVGKVALEDAVSLRGLDFACANVGNPHAITFVEDVEVAPVMTLGPTVETDGYFPNKTNVEFVQVINEDTIKVRIWERGVGETMACGTGMVASAVVSSAEKSTSLPVNVEVPGGVALIWLDNEGYARMLGPAETVFVGEV